MAVGYFGKEVNLARLLAFLPPPASRLVNQLDSSAGQQQIENCKDEYEKNPLAFSRQPVQ